MFSLRLEASRARARHFFVLPARRPRRPACRSFHARALGAWRTGDRDRTGPTRALASRRPNVNSIVLDSIGSMLGWEGS